MLKGILKVFSGDIAGGSSTNIYTIPDGKTLFIVGGMTSAYSAGGGIGAVGIRKDNSSGDLLTGLLVSTIKVSGDMPQSFLIPIVLPMKTQLWACSNHINAAGNYSIITYEVDNILLPTFM